MAENPKLLVVDDEEVVCQACRRIFSRQGFDVETTCDAREGLAWATQKKYRIILLDIKMPNMDGIQFLEALREKDPEVPVLIITGYPSIPNAAAAMRLGASDYVTKPFTSEEITRAVQRVLATRPEPVEPVATEAPPPAEAAPVEQVLFWHESWFRLEADGSACVGVVLSGLHRANQIAIRLPRIGEVVYQGLPMASVAAGDAPPVLVPAPISGVVVAVNESLPQHPSRLASDPCGEGWLACVCTTRYEEELKNCRPRYVLLANADPRSAEEQAKRLNALGCQVQTLADRDAVAAALNDVEGRVLILDAVSWGDSGPDLVGLVNSRAPSLRIVVVAAQGAALETAYRKKRIFYYAVEPFADSEIADILAAAFRVQETPKPERAKGPSEPISTIAITNRQGHKVQLMAGPGLLWRNEGLGYEIGQRLLAMMFPVVVTPGEANLTPANILKTAGACDRVLVLLARDSGLLPGALARQCKPDFAVEAGDAAGKITTLAVQPDAVGGIAGLDARTRAALADHIVREMASY